MKDDNQTDHFIRKAKLIKLVDGDTFKVQIDLGWNLFTVTNIRLEGCDTPEIRGAEKLAGEYVVKRLRAYIKSRTGMIQDCEIALRSHEFRTGKYGRCICSVYVDGSNVSTWLLRNRLAWKTNRHGVLQESRDIRNLHLPFTLKNAIETNYNL